jgi:hydrogenase expression/formation protein HypC
MCIAYPARLISIDPAGSAVADVAGTHRSILLIALTDDVAPGDWVLVHTGIAVARITPQEADDLQSTLEQARRAQS